jgi:hypothetical protein
MGTTLKSKMGTALKNRKLLTVAIAVAALALPASASAVVDYGSQPGYGTATSHSCNSDHGAFTYYSDGSARTEIVTRAQSGDLRDNTGDNNSTFAQNCKG